MELLWTRQQVVAVTSLCFVLGLAVSQVALNTNDLAIRISSGGPPELQPGLNKSKDEHNALKRESAASQKREVATDLAQLKGKGRSPAPTPNSYAGSVSASALDLDGTGPTLKSCCMSRI